ncbi:MAG: threonine synthase [Candidatus Latescibacteria bacterium]|nr:threonine synthase [Candidatus Latescibacterota bacterium]
MSFLTHLECSRTGQQYDPRQLHNLSADGAPLLARYDLERVAGSLKKSDLQQRPPHMWRYHEVLPVGSPEEIVSLGEGYTPLHRAERLGAWAGCSHLYIKDESLNPTGSFKARGMATAVSAARARGARRLAVPSAGNAGGALAAYAAAAGLEAFVFMPRDVPLAFQVECRACGAQVELIEGLISDCGRVVAQRKEAEGWFEVSTLKEPYRVEGKKTMGYELAEQLGWELPEAVIYPTGGGTGLIGMWKAFAEMEQLGWIGARRPRMFSVQAAGCAPIVRAFEQGEERAVPWEKAHTVAAGLRVPGAVGDFLMLRAIRQSGGAAVAVSDEEIMDACRHFARCTGILPAPEGGAALAGLLALKERGLVGAGERIALFNTGSGYKYLEAFSLP